MHMKCLQVICKTYSFLMDETPMTGLHCQAKTWTMIFLRTYATSNRESRVSAMRDSGICTTTSFRMSQIFLYLLRERVQKCLGRSFRHISIFNNVPMRLT